MSGLLAKPIGYLLSLIYSLVNNYGLSIIILTVLVRLILLPLYSKQIKESAKMAELQPKVKELQVRYAHDRNQMNEKMNELYQKENVKPTSGCLPLLIQFPVIIGLFSLLRNPLDYINTPAMKAAVHESFIWVPDISQPDSWILPILAGLTTYFTYSATSSTDATGSMNAMKYFFPIMIFLLGRTYPAGLALYWAVGNVFMIFQTLYFNKKKEDDKLRKTAEEEIRKSLKKAK